MMLSCLMGAVTFFTAVMVYNQPKSLSTDKDMDIHVSGYLQNSKPVSLKKGNSAICDSIDGTDSTSHIVQSEINQV